MKGKSNLSGSKNDNEGTAQKMDGVEKLSLKVKANSRCNTHDRSCAVLDSGEHIRLIPEDFAKWVTMIVSQSSSQRGISTE